jgi:hypothetical protein
MCRRPNRRLSGKSTRKQTKKNIIPQYNVPATFFVDLHECSGRSIHLKRIVTSHKNGEKLNHLITPKPQSSDQPQMELKSTRQRVQTQRGQTPTGTVTHTRHNSTNDSGDDTHGDGSQRNKRLPAQLGDWDAMLTERRQTHHTQGSAAGTGSRTHVDNVCIMDAAAMILLHHRAQ